MLDPVLPEAAILLLPFADVWVAQEFDIVSGSHGILVVRSVFAY